MKISVKIIINTICFHLLTVVFSGAGSHLGTVVYSGAGSLSISLSLPLDDEESLLSSDELESPRSSGPDVKEDDSDECTSCTSCEDCDLIIVLRNRDSNPSLRLLGKLEILSDYKLNFLNVHREYLQRFELVFWNASAPSHLIHFSLCKLMMESAIILAVVFW